MKSIMTVLLAGAVVSLSGCAGIDRMNAQMAAQQHTADQNKCSGFGYQPGTDAFADCMMSTQHQRDQQQADAQHQAAWENQRNADRKARKDTADAAADAKHRDDVEKMMSADHGSVMPIMPTTPSMPTGTDCTTTTTTSQGDNAGSSTSTTKCH